ncbi:hypothetical protein Godav_017431 [Gossypium davidsonii]|uniref:Uncharacterized protein n=2 Tax=Gossypium TaxID=3633 RepID=A0A7J8QU60_GOSDV|nr:hypothetical protein [Gossypium davidsonii]MBA0639684.1 hypothetical protein [Gossypium klotzschianum]
MEDCGNIFEKQVIGVSKTKVGGKPPTRLQKHAPESLKLDQMKAAEAPIPIPLLTPLASSPISFPETDDFMFLMPNNMNAPTPTTFGWKPPVRAGFNVEAPTLLALFHNKCVLVNDAK